MAKAITQFIGVYRFLSNFQPCLVRLDATDEFYYPSVEHAYQAAKTVDFAQRDEVRQAPTAKEAKRLGRQVTIRPNWNEYRLLVMDDLLVQKFVNNKQFSKMLLATGDAHLEEGNYWGDRFWGTVNGVGENNLGKLLMKIREELKGGVDGTR